MNSQWPDTARSRCRQAASDGWRIGLSPSVTAPVGLTPGRTLAQGAAGTESPLISFSARLLSSRYAVRAPPALDQSGSSRAWAHQHCAHENHRGTRPGRPIEIVATIAPAKNTRSIEFSIALSAYHFLIAYSLEKFDRSSVCSSSSARHSNTSRAAFHTISVIATLMMIWRSSGLRTTAGGHRAAYVSCEQFGRGAVAFRVHV